MFRDVCGYPGRGYRDSSEKFTILTLQSPSHPSHRSGQIALCNPVMLVLVGFVLWASLLYVALEDVAERAERRSLRDPHAHDQCYTYLVPISMAVGSI